MIKKYILTKYIVEYFNIERYTTLVDGKVNHLTSFTVPVITLL